MRAIRSFLMTALILPCFLTSKETTIIEPSQTKFAKEYQMDVMQLANVLKKEANDLLKNELLWKSFEKKGKIYVAGSTYLNLLAFPDLDVYFEAKDAKSILTVFADAAKSLIVLDQVKSIELEKDLHQRYPKQVPEGLFLQYRIDNGYRLWKVDIWAVADKSILDSKMQESARFKEKMTLEQKELILQAKHQLMAPFGRTPVGSSYLVYVAVLEKGLNTVDEIIDYIRAQGGNVDKLK